MNDALDFLVRALILVAPVLLGALAGILGLFPSPDGAVRTLNRYALYFAFPALVFGGIVDARFGLPSSIFFWLLVPVVMVIGILLARPIAAATGLRRDAGSMALVVAFGNVAYLGLPVVEKSLGAAAMGTAALAVALHVTLAMLMGPVVLLRWTGGNGGPQLKRVLVQPLLWAPLIGLGIRALPEGGREIATAVAHPLGRSAAPVALFLLGLYLQTHRGRLKRVGGSGAAHVVMRLLVVPALTIAACLAGVALGELSALEARVFVILSGMPAAITTFAIAQELDRGVDAVAKTIVASTVVAIATIPLTIWVAVTLF